MFSKLLLLLLIKGFSIFNFFFFIYLRWFFFLYLRFFFFIYVYIDHVNRCNLAACQAKECSFMGTKKIIDEHEKKCFKILNERIEKMNKQSTEKCIEIKKLKNTVESIKEFLSQKNLLENEEEIENQYNLAIHNYQNIYNYLRYINIPLNNNDFIQFDETANIYYNPEEFTQHINNFIHKINEIIYISNSSGNIIHPYMHIVYNM